MRGAIEIQFHWIFVLIAGSIILLVFFGFIQSQRAATETAISARLARDIQAISAGTLAARGSAQTISVGSAAMDILCDDACNCEMNIDGISTPLEHPTFAHAHLEHPEAIFWSAEWRVPFRVDNFLFLTNPNIKYYFVYSSRDGASQQLRQRLADILPKDLAFEFVELQNILNIAHEEYAASRFVFLNVGFFDALMNRIHPSFSGTDVSAVLINSPAGTVTFYTPEETKTLPYLSEASMLGAIFAHANLYACNMKQGVEKLHFVSRVLAERTADLQSKNINLCAYDRATTILQQISSRASQRDISDLGGLRSAELEDINNNLLAGGCPVVY